MTSTGTSNSFAEWEVESFRLSIFHPEPVTRPGLWAKFVGDRPQTINDRPHDGIVQEQGDYEGNRLVLTSMARRIDWHVGPIPPTAPTGGSTPTLTEPAKVISLLARATTVSTKEIPQVDRFAFGAVLVKQPPTEAEVLHHFSQYFPDKGLDSSDTSDFMYQINRRCRSVSAPHVVVNRVARWSLEQVQSGNLQISTGAPVSVQMLGPRLTGKLVLDINTAPENNAISVNRLPTFFSEFVAFAYDIALKGDSL